MSDGKLQNVEIFKVGKWRGSKTVDATPEMLKQIVDNFATINQVPGYGVPVKLGHSNKVGSPAYGWMSELALVGDTLVADFGDMEPATVDAIGKRRYNSVSVELYPSIEYDGKVYPNVLGGVALLGSEWPAVKGLKPLSASLFSETAEKLVLELTQEIDVADETTKFSQADHDTLVTAAVAKAKAEVAIELKAAQDAVAVEKARADKAEAEVKTFKDAADQKVIDGVIEAAEKAGKIVPANKEKITKFAASVLKATDPAQRAELMSTFSELVSAQPVKVKFGEDGKAKADAGVETGEKVADTVDARAKAEMSKDTKLSYENAVNKVLAADPELKRAYAQEM